MWTAGWGKSEAFAVARRAERAPPFFHAGWATLKLPVSERAYYNSEPSLLLAGKSIPLHLSEDL